MSKYFLLLLTATTIFFTSCDKDDDTTPSVEAPATYAFTRNNESTVSFSGQTTRIQMATELINGMKDFSIEKSQLLEMYRNETEAGEDANPFSDADLNVSTKSVRSKVAASKEYFSDNVTDGTAIKELFETWINAQVDEVFPNESTLAEAGVAGQIADGSSTRYVNSKGLEYNQLVNKSLIGGLMLDQILNNYLSTTVLDEATNIEDNDADVLAEGKPYTTMEHKWDEAYGYAYGTAADLADPNKTIGADDSFLNKYIGRVEGDADFAGIAAEIFDAFKLGRAAIEAKDYDLRDEQVVILRKALSKVIAVRAVYYLAQGKSALEASPANYGTAFHDLSEGYGFVYSLQFTHNPDTGKPYFSKAEVDAFIADMLGDGANGLWDVQPSTLDAIATTIAAAFDFTVAQAAE
ncbi:MAG: DUF4856 domain-containing protein [Chitinophagales bacterium]|nr:DUF4856 domain-containing protein [Chitinophagales bacterium]